MLKNYKKITLSLLLTLSLPFSILTGCDTTNTELSKRTDHSSEVFKIEFLDVFDTFIQVLASDVSKEEFEKTGNEIYQDLREMHELFDIFQAYPGRINLYTVNSHAGKGPIEVDPLLFELLDFSIKMHDLTGGKTNIALGSVLKLWHDARTISNQDSAKAYIPKQADLKAAAMHCNIQDIKLDPAKLTVEILDPALQIDTGSIAKGFAAEKIAQKLTAQGKDHLLLNFGGNVRTIGTKSQSGQRWKVAIQNPDLNAQSPYLYMLEIESKSTVTSGVYERFFSYEGQKYHHIIDNETLLPGTRYAGVSIITHHSGIADALSTAVFLLDEESGAKLAEQIGDTEILWVYPNGEEKQTPGFTNYRAGK